MFLKALFSILFFTIRIYAQSIHVLGDSHAREFSEISGCICHHVGPITMHRVGRDGLDFLNIKNIGVQEKDIVIFAFGEIDARCHIGKQRDLKKRSLEEIIETLVQKYIHTICLNCALFKKIYAIVYSVTPPTDIVFNVDYPIYGPIEERVAITKLLNNALKEACHHNGIYFLDVYQDYATPQGTLRIELSDLSVHIHPHHSGFIRDKLNRLIKTFK